jgi:hypothetical protein
MTRLQFGGAGAGQVMVEVLQSRAANRLERTRKQVANNSPPSIARSVIDDEHARGR